MGDGDGGASCVGSSDVAIEGTFFFVAALLWMTTQGKELAADNFEAKGT
jgi:hypothetical protein